MSDQIPLWKQLSEAKERLEKGRVEAPSLPPEPEIPDGIDEPSVEVEEVDASPAENAIEVSATPQTAGGADSGESAPSKSLASSLLASKPKEPKEPEALKPENGGVLSGPVSYPLFSSDGTDWEGREWFVLTKLHYSKSEGRITLSATKDVTFVVEGKNLDSVVKMIAEKKLRCVSPDPKSKRLAKDVPYIEKVEIIPYKKAGAADPPDESEDGDPE